MSAEIDMTGFERAMNDLATSVRQDSSTFLRGEASRLGDEIAKQLSRRAKVKGENTIAKDVASVFSPEPKKVFKDHRKDGTRLNWLYATPYDLVGVDPALDHRSSGLEDLKGIYYPNKGMLPGERRKLLGLRQTSVRINKRTGHEIKHQRVFELQRLVVKRGVLKRFMAWLNSHRGRLEASFADTANKLGGHSEASGRVSRHFPSPKNITRDDSQNAIPYITLGSTAPGVSKFLPQVETAVQIRKEKMIKRLGHIVRGYAQSLRRGRITPQAEVQQFEE